MKHVLKKLGIGKHQILNKEHLLSLKGGVNSCGPLSIYVNPCVESGYGTEEECAQLVISNCTPCGNGWYNCCS